MIDVSNSNPVLIERSRLTPSGRLSIRNSSKDPEMAKFDWEPLFKIRRVLKEQFRKVVNC